MTRVALWHPTETEGTITAGEDATGKDEPHEGTITAGERAAGEADPSDDAAAAVYHDRAECPAGRVIPPTQRAPGTGSLELCPICRRLPE